MTFDKFSMQPSTPAEAGFGDLQDSGGGLKKRGEIVHHDVQLSAVDAGSVGHASGSLQAGYGRNSGSGFDRFLRVGCLTTPS
ncbi:MAG TPA: hypothetical protein VJY39_19185 [Acidisphaera sp.]|nr:hypothetical protein [Acidisphaera sp.]HME20903.1 hypothetical protein [Acetobacteraceae bacterium]